MSLRQADCGEGWEGVGVGVGVSSLSLCFILFFLRRSDVILCLLLDTRILMSSSSLSSTIDLSASFWLLYLALYNPISYLSPVSTVALWKSSVRRSESIHWGLFSLFYDHKGSSNLRIILNHTVTHPHTQREREPLCDQNR